MKRPGSTYRMLDLAAYPPESHQRLRADVCIVGAGAAGCYLARALSDRGQEVVLLEAGGKAVSDSCSIGELPKMTISTYSGATKGRFFGLGGSTARWGGALVPHGWADTRQTGPFAAAWSLIADVVKQRSAQVLRTLGCTIPVDFECDAKKLFARGTHVPTDSTLKGLATVYLPFRKKNLRGLLDATRSLTTVIHATAVRWQLSSDSHALARLESVEAVAPNGARMCVKARKFILAAGAIESARILLEIDRAHDSRVLPVGVQTGQFLSDHLSSPIAHFTAKRARQVRHLYAPRFQGSWMRSLRYVATGQGDTQPRAFIHVVFHHDSPGLRMVQEALQALQGARRPTLSWLEILRGTHDIVAIATCRLLRRRLFIPDSSKPVLQLDVEQTPDPENRVTLSDTMDRYDRPVASIRWRVSEADHSAFCSLARAALRNWPASLPTPAPIDLNVDSPSPYGSYHPCGITRLGMDEGATLDVDLRVRGFTNLWSVSTGILPSAGSANPTFTMLCFAERLVEHLSQDRTGSRNTEPNG